MDGQPPHESDEVVAYTSAAQSLSSGTSTEKLIATIVNLLAKQVAREIIDTAKERP